MFSNRRFHIGIVIVVLALGGCTTKISLNTGQTEYRVHDSRGNGDSSCSDGGSSCPVGWKKYENPGAVSGATILEDEIISVHLKQAFISDFAERAEKFFSGAFTTTVRGEIAILARVFELGKDNSIDFSPAELKASGRVVYYGEDVRTNGHFLNQSMVPIFGPTKYHGNPLVIELSALELDVGESAQFRGMMTTLAALGKKAYPPGAPVLSALETIGTELLSGEQDDHEFRYAMVLYPEVEGATTTYPILTEGDYVFVKQDPNKFLDGLTKSDEVQHRFSPVPWDTLSYDPKIGVLSEGSEGKPYLERTYFVVQINKGFKEIDGPTTKAYKDFETSILKIRDSEDFKKKLSDNIDTFQMNALAENNATRIAKIHGKAKSLIAAMCDKNAANALKHNQIEFYEIVKERRSFPDLPTQPAPTGSPPNTATKATFTDTQWDDLVRFARSYNADPALVNRASLEKLASAQAISGVITCNRQ